MKRTIALLTLALLLLLSGCSPKGADKSYPVTLEGPDGSISATVRFNHGGLSDGVVDAFWEEYDFVLLENGRFAVTYPNGKRYEVGVTNNVDLSEYEQSKYATQASLYKALSQARNAAVRRDRSGGGQDFFKGLFIAAAGLFLVKFPNALWFLNKGLWYKNAEPSEFATGYYIFFGAILLFVGGIMMISGLFTVLFP